MKDNGGSAFPQMAAMDQNGSWIAANKHCPEASGMSLRDYFAAAALTSISRQKWDAESWWDHKTAAEHAYRFADSMLAERDKP